MRNHVIQKKKMLNSCVSLYVWLVINVGTLGHIIVQLPITLNS